MPVPLAVSAAAAAAAVFVCCGPIDAPPPPPEVIGTSALPRREPLIDAVAVAGPPVGTNVDVGMVDEDVR
jgi:hypothetical protein